MLTLEVVERATKIEHAKLYRLNDDAWLLWASFSDVDATCAAIGEDGAVSFLVGDSVIKVAGFERRMERIWTCDRGELQAVICDYNYDDAFREVAKWERGAEG